MTFENLTADADALRRRLGYQRWAVLGHWFGGYVALEYALRCPGSLSHLVLVDTGGDSASGASATPATLAASSAAPARPWPGGCRSRPQPRRVRGRAAPRRRGPPRAGRTPGTARSRSPVARVVRRWDLPSLARFGRIGGPGELPDDDAESDHRYH